MENRTMRTETITYKVFNFDELSEEAKEFAYNKWLEHNHEDFGFHAEWVIENFERDIQEYGVESSRVHYSGFCSQGDGAMFEGHVVDPTKLIKQLDTSSFPDIAKDIEGVFDVAQWKHRGYYCHENSIEYDIRVGPYIDNDENDEYYDLITGQVEAFENSIIEFVRDKCQDLYSQLEKAYEWANSREYFEEENKANEIEYLESGKVFYK